VQAGVAAAIRLPVGAAVAAGPVFPHRDKKQTFITRSVQPAVPSGIVLTAGGASRAGWSAARHGGAAAHEAQSTVSERKNRAALAIALETSPGALRLVPAERTDVRGRRRHTPAGLLDGQRVAPLSGDVTSIGRGLTNSVVLLDPAVSREHAYILRDGAGWWIENASQHNTVVVEGCALAPGERQRLTPGSRFRLGDTTLQLLASAQAEPPVPLSPHLDASGDGLPASSPLGATADPATSSGTHLLGPGVTLQFIMRGGLRPRVLWTLGIVVLLLFVASATVMLGAAALIGQAALASGGMSSVLAALTIPLVPAVGITVLVAAIDRYEREPWLLLAGAFLWGAVIAVPPVFFAEHALTQWAAQVIPPAGAGAAVAAASLHALGAGVIEEVVKGAGLLLLLIALRDEFDNVTDGIVYGLLIGAGFAMVENYAYFALSPRAELPLLILGRIVLGWLGHSTFTALFGAGLGYARERQRGSGRWRIPALGLLGAIALHTYFDAVLFAANALAHDAAAPRDPTGFAAAALALAYLPLFAAQAGVLWLAVRALAREAEVIREHLVEEVVRGVVTPGEYLLVQQASQRNAIERAYLLAGGLRLYLTARALYQAETGLAFRKWHVALGDPSKRAQRQPEDVYRARIVRLRRSLLRQLLATARQTADSTA
jgi:RsiW-degrading membrane proteinase PrsW (M82 family)